MEGRELKCARMVKRSQCKNKFSPVNYKERIFVLTENSLTYYEGSLVKRGRSKCSIPLLKIKAVEKVDREAFNRRNSFQVMYDDFVLYTIASTSSEQEEWMSILRNRIANNNCLLTFFHPGVFSSNKWTCCHHCNKLSTGCKATFTGRRAATTSVVMSPSAHDNRRSLMPDHKSRPGDEQVPSGQRTDVEGVRPFDVIAIYNYVAVKAGDLHLTKGQRLTVFDDRREHWWHAENASGTAGFIPSNYVRRVGVSSEAWFYPAVSRQRAETILCDDGKEGCFLVRNSSKPGMYTLSVVHNGFVRHYHIQQDSGELFFISQNHHFETIPELIEYHSYNGGGLVTRLKRPPRQDQPTEPPTRDKWEIDPADLTFGGELGSGQFGRVIQGTYKGKTNIAIKMMKVGTMEEDDFIEEAKVMKSFQHPNLVQLYGVVTVQRPILIVTELMENGCLLSYLHLNPHLQSQVSVLIDMTIQVASAMQFLEEHLFIHRDLAARNCLVKARFQVKVGDFGLARHVLDDEYTASEGTKFPIKWAAPEVISYAKFSSKSDVWAFGILVWEIFSGGAVPYPAFSNGQMLDEMLQGYRMDQPENCPDEIFNIVRDMWLEEPNDRPAFSTLHKRLSQIGSDYSDPD